MYFTCSALFLVIGLGIGGLIRAPLNFTMKIRFPVLQPADAHDVSVLVRDVAPLHLTISFLEVKKDIMMTRSHPGTFIA